MALITKIDNTASVLFGGSPVNSNTVETILNIAPTIVKTVDKTVANVGDTLTYTIVITNVGLTTINNLAFSDVIATGGTYVADSFMVNGTTQKPTITGQTIAYTVPIVASGSIISITFQVKITG